MNFYRGRRLRFSKIMRKLVRETTLSPSQLIYPVFVVFGSGKTEPIPSMPGLSRYSVDKLGPVVDEIIESGVNSVILFGIPEHKDEKGSGAYDPNGVVQRAIREIKSRAGGELLVVADVCLCEYTSHGHCGIVNGSNIDNDATLPILADTAQSLAEAGADIIAPSDMMDGRVAVIRKRLDETGFAHLPIMSYSAKFASAFYGPFRDAAEGAPKFGDRSSYQLDPPNAGQALREMEEDLAEGADILMVKPALAYLDILKEASYRFDCPLAAYNVSGEFSMIKAAAKMGWMDEKRATLEILTSIKRAGADIIITYHALKVAKWLAEEEL